MSETGQGTREAAARLERAQAAAADLLRELHDEGALRDCPRLGDVEEVLVEWRAASQGFLAAAAAAAAAAPPFTWLDHYDLTVTGARDHLRAALEGRADVRSQASSEKITRADVAAYAGLCAQCEGWSLKRAEALARDVLGPLRANERRALRRARGY